jgi:hypothetical protein
MFNLKQAAVCIALSSATAIASTSPSAAFVGPGPTSVAASHDGGTITTVQYRRGFGGRGFGGRRFGRRGFGGRGYGGYGVGAGLAGLAAGAVIGGAIASSARPAYGYGYGAPVAVYPANDAVAYCESRFRSYNPATGTYTGYDGLYHRCP